MLGSLITGTLGASIGAYLFGTPRQENENSWADAGDISDLRVGSPEQVSFASSRIDGWKVRNEKASAWVILGEEHSVKAFSPMCTHLGCAYHWERRSQAFVCPCHGSTFRADGSVISGPAPRPLDRYAVRVEGSRLWLGPLETSKES